MLCGQKVSEVKYVLCGCYDSSHTSKTRAIQTSQGGTGKDRYESPIGLLSGDVLYFLYWLNGISIILSLERT